MKTRPKLLAVGNNGTQNDAAPVAAIPGIADARFPASLADAETQLRAAAARFKQSGAQQFEALKDVCFQIFATKQIFAKTPKKLRPAGARSWEKYAPAIAAKCGLEFETARMADYYAELYVDMTAVGIHEVQKRVSDGSYREARKAANELLNKTGKKPSGAVSCALLRQAAAVIGKAMEHAGEDGHLRSLSPVRETVSKAALADRLKMEDVVPELATFGLPDAVRHRINFAVRATSSDPVAAGVHALDQSLLGTPHEEGSITLPEWSRPADAALAPTPEDVAHWAASWLMRRDALIVALVRKYDHPVKRSAS